MRGGPAPGPSPARRGGAAARRLRLASGLVLFAFLTTHLSNHALGLVSLGLMEDGRLWFLWLWRNPVGTVALYGALLTHVVLALWSLYRRRHLRMPAWEALQLLLGLSVPPLLASHVVGTRLAVEWFDSIDAYSRIVLLFWEVRPWVGARQALLVVLVWTHVGVGLHFWLRLRPWYARLALPLFGAWLLLPVLALLGFAQAGREVAALARQPGWVALLLEATHAPDAAARATLDTAVEAILLVYGASLAGVLLARAARGVLAARRGTVRILYHPGLQPVVVPVGLTLLEASRFAGIPHASVCGGRGRCSTCRVRVDAGGERLAPPSAAEHRVLERVGAPPAVRLACQVRPAHDLAVTLLLAAAATPADGLARPPGAAGRERELTVLFADLRGFTRLAEHKLPYDVVFFLNRYFETVGGAIERAGGLTNQFTGDGVMALFGVEAGPEEASRQALVAAGEMVAAVARLSGQLAVELAEPLRLGIGIHTGPAVVGEMGYAATRYLTAVGDTVHVAARLEQLTKEYDCQLVISEQVARRAGLDASRHPRHLLTLRNRQEPLTVHVIDDALAAAQAVSGGRGGAEAPR